MAAQRAGGMQVAIWGRREAAVEELRARGIGDLASSDLRKVVHEAGLAILCVPIGAMPALARELAEVLPEQAIVTDVGSVKLPVVRALEPLFATSARFVGSHPMAGSEQQGLEAARVDLFEGRVCIVTPTQHSEPSAVDQITSFWQQIGCRVRLLDPAEHDTIAATISHFPHALAALLVQSVAQQHPAAFEFAGPGFRDTTRVASGPPEMWLEILDANRAAVQKSAEAMIEKLREFITMLARGDSGGQASMNELLTFAKEQRDRLRLRP